MPVTRFQMKDGRVTRFEVPDGTTPEQAQSMVSQYLARSQPTQNWRNDPVVSLPKRSKAARENDPIITPAPKARGRYVIEDDEPAPTTASKRYVIEDAPEPGFGEKVNTGLDSLPRQLGLTARHGIEGLAQVADIPGAPLAYLMNKALPAKQTLSGLVTGEQPLPRFQKPSAAVSGALDRMGLPTPNTPTERVVGDASRILAGGGGMVKGTQAAGKVLPALLPLAARPGLQASSAVGSGLAVGYTRETGGDPTSQLVAALLGGVAAPGAVAGLNAGGNYVRNTINAIRDVKPPQVNIQITNAIQQAGYNPASVPKRVMNMLETDAADAMRQGELSPDALRRLVDYRLIGATPARGNLTLNPVDLTKQHNLSKIGANSSSPKLQGLAMRQNDNTGTLLRNLNEMGANTADDAYAGGQKVMGALERTAGRKQGAINDAYEAARAKTGIDAEIDPSAFTQRAGDLLRENLLEGALPADIRRILNDAAAGKIPLTVRTAEQIKTAMGNLQRSSADGGTRRAIGLVRQALDDAPLLPGRQANPGNLPAVPGTVPPSMMQQGDDAISAFNQARGLNRNWRGLVEKTPALQAIEDGVQPDKFVQQYIIQGAGKANVMDVARLKNAVKDSPEALQAIRGQILAHLKAKATSGKSDEAMTFSQSGYNNAFAGIGERKLRMFFDRAEIDKMKAVGRVAMYEQIQPSGSAVNNSNTAAMAIGRLFDGILQKIPFGEAALSGPAKNITTSYQAGGVSNIPKALNLPQKAVPGQRIPLPLLLTPGLLEDRPKGLLGQSYGENHE